MWRENLENHSVDVKSVDALGFGIPGNLGRAHNRNPMDFCCLFPKLKLAAGDHRFLICVGEHTAWAL